jgi:hypothetical protein
MGSTFDHQPVETSQPPSPERRLLEQRVARRRMTRNVLATAISLPVLGTVALLAGLTVVYFGDSIGLNSFDRPARKVPARALNVTEWQTHRDLQRQRADEREEEELRQIRLRVDRAVESREREAQRAADREADRQAPQRAKEKPDETAN